MSVTDAVLVFAVLAVVVLVPLTLHILLPRQGELSGRHHRNHHKHDPTGRSS